LLVFLVGAAVSCERPPECAGEYCGTLIFAAAGEPSTLFPPMTNHVLARDVSDQIFLKLADLGPSLNTVGDADFQPQLARSWEWDDPLTLVFHLDPRARWHDGRAVTAADVAFTFDAYTDSVVASPSAPSLHRIRAVTARDSLTAVVRFREQYREMFYDAVYHMRILPAHVLHVVPRDRWATAEFGRDPVGAGPYRFASWRAGEAIELEADSTFFLGRPYIRRLVWRVSSDLPSAINLLLADEADAVEVVFPPDNLARVREAAHLQTYEYPGGTYTYLAFNHRALGDTSKPHPIFSHQDVRRALFLATDRERIVRSTLGDLARVPGGPMPQMWWQWGLDTRAPGYDSAQAVYLLNRAGWRDTDGDGVRERNGVKLSFTLTVPTTSAIRRTYAQLLQAQYRLFGVEVAIDEVDNAILAERGPHGQFDAALVSWQTDASAVSSFPMIWTARGWGGNNWGRYRNAEFERLLADAMAAGPAESRRAWQTALRRLNEDAAGIWLYAISNVAAVNARVIDVRIRPDSWWALVRTWRVPPERLIARDRAGGRRGEH
jgi:peptide/nickel transport system substrate-binding protein